MLSNTAEYALKAMAVLAAGDANTNEIARIGKIPADYLAKVIQELRRAGLVTTKRGVGGGASLMKKPNQITLWQVVHAVDPTPANGGSPAALSSLYRKLADASAQYKNALAATTLADVVAKTKR